MAIEDQENSEANQPRISPRLITRRSLLKGGLGAAGLATLGTFIAPVFNTSGKQHRDNAVPVSADLFSPLFLFGLTKSNTQAASLHFFLPGSMPGLAQTSSSPPQTSTGVLVSQPSSSPTLSPDGQHLAVAEIVGSPVPTAISLYLIDRSTANVETKADLELPTLPVGTLIICTPAFLSNSTKLGLLIAIMEPTTMHTVRKVNPNTGEQIVAQAPNWVSYHMLAFFDSESSLFTGPVSLNNAPSLANARVVADESSVYVFAVAEYAALGGSKESPATYPMTQIWAYDFGAQSPRYQVATSTYWPVNMEPTVVNSNDTVARLVAPDTIESYTTTNGSSSPYTVAFLTGGSAKPTPTTMQLQSSGELLLVRAGLGRATLVDPTNSFTPSWEITFASPKYYNGGISTKGVLSADGSKFYVLGGKSVGGIAAYDVSTGQMVEAASDGTHFSGLALSQGGQLIAYSPDSQAVSLYNPQLAYLGKEVIDIYVSELY